LHFFLGNASYGISSMRRFRRGDGGDLGRKRLHEKNTEMAGNGRRHSRAAPVFSAPLNRGWKRIKRLYIVGCAVQLAGGAARRWGPGVKVFISYRRGDAKGIAGRLADRLGQEVQIDEVFFDTEEIGAGEDFEAKIRRSLMRSSLCFVLIGDKWSGEGVNRLFEERDFVRLEVGEALQTVGKVIPVLIDGARMPSVHDLPSDLQPLTRLNAVMLRHESFRRDADFLADAALARKPPGPLSRYWNRHPFQESLVRSLAGLLVAALLLVGGAAVHKASTGHSLDEALGGIGPVLLLVAGALAAGVIVPLILRKRRRRVPA